MKAINSINNRNGAPVQLLKTKKLWKYCLNIGFLFWIIALLLWAQQEVDKSILFYFNATRIQMAPIILISKWLSSYGMATITTILILYLFASKIIKRLDAPEIIYFYTICSFGISGIIGDILKEIIARPRPVALFGNEILALSQSATASFPSGHATKSIALILPFVLLVKDSKVGQKIIQIIIAIIAGGICVSRIILGAHFFSDVLAGIGTALIGLPLSMLFANLPLSKLEQKLLPNLSLIWGILLVLLTFLFILL